MEQCFDIVHFCTKPFSIINIHSSSPQYTIYPHTLNPELYKGFFPPENPANSSTTAQSILSHHASKKPLFPPTPQSLNHTCSHVLTPSSTSRSAPPGAACLLFLLYAPIVPALPAAGIAANCCGVVLPVIADVAVDMSSDCWRKCAPGYGEPAL